LALEDLVTNPIETHVHGFGAFLFDIVVGNAGGSAVVSLNWCRRLGMSEFFETGKQWAGFFTIMAEGSKFSLGSGRWRVLLSKFGRKRGWHHWRLVQDWWEEVAWMGQGVNRLGSESQQLGIGL
jgi:hypothetical protein